MGWLGYIRGVREVVLPSPFSCFSRSSGATHSGDYLAWSKRLLFPSSRFSDILVNVLCLLRGSTQSVFGYSHVSTISVFSFYFESSSVSPFILWSVGPATSKGVQMWLILPSSVRLVLACAFTRGCNRSKLGVMPSTCARASRSSTVRLSCVVQSASSLGGFTQR